MGKSNMKNLLWCVPMAVLLAGPSMATDYDDAKPSIYVDDLANEALFLPKILGCIFQQAGVGADNRLTNAVWTALVNETTCNLEDSNPPTFAKTVLSSSRASATTPQEVTGWMDTSVGDKMIMSAVLTQAPSDVDPFGRYTVSFYLANPEGGDTTIDVTELNEGDDPAMFGYAYVYADGNDIVVDSMLLESDNGTEMTVRAVIKDGDPDNILYGLSLVSDTSIKALGATDADKSFRYLLDENLAEIGAQCTSRTTAWQNTWQMGVFDAVTGDRVQLENPSLSFETAAGNYGDVNSDWFWIDGPERLSLTPANNELSFRAVNQSEDKILVWTPASLRTNVTVPYVPDDGDTVRYWQFDSTGQGTEFDAVFEADGFYYDDGFNQNPVPVPSYRWVWSQQYNMQIFIGEDGANKTYTGNKNIPVTPSAAEELFFTNSVERKVASAAKLSCVGWDCPDKNLRLGADALATLIADNGGTLPWDAFKSTGGSRDPNAIFTYFLAPLNLPEDSDFVAGALYHDANGSDALDTGDVPLMFDFRMDWRDKSVYEWGGIKNQRLTDALAGANNPWLGFNFDLVTSSCDLSVSGEKYDLFQDCDKVTYNHSAQQQYSYVRNADGSYYEFSDPITLKLANFDPENHDRNFKFAQNALTAGGTPEFGTVLDGDWNPLTGLSCDVLTWQADFEARLGDTVGIPLVYEGESGKYCLLPVAPDYFEGQTFYLDYDGRSLQGLNGVENVINDRWYQMINLKTGTELVDASDNTKKYKVKPVYIDEYMLNLTQDLDPTEDGAIGRAKDSCAGGDIVFNLNDINEDGNVMSTFMSDLPPLWFNDEYVKPTVSWSDRPTVTSASNCFVKDKEVTCPTD